MPHQLLLITTLNPVRKASQQLSFSTRSSIHDLKISPAGCLWLETDRKPCTEQNGETMPIAAPLPQPLVPYLASSISAPSSSHTQTLVTSTLSTPSLWLLLRLACIAIYGVEDDGHVQRRRQQPHTVDSGGGGGGGGERHDIRHPGEPEGTNVVIVSFVRDYLTWCEMGKKLVSCFYFPLPLSCRVDLGLAGSGFCRCQTPEKRREVSSPRPIVQRIQQQSSVSLLPRPGMDVLSSCSSGVLKGGSSTASVSAGLDLVRRALKVSEMLTCMSWETPGSRCSGSNKGEKTLLRGWPEEGIPAAQHSFDESWLSRPRYDDAEITGVE